MAWDAGSAGSRIDLRGLKKAGGGSAASGPAELKDAGNTALKSGDLEGAVAFYSKALDAKPAQSLQVTLLSNRAEVQLRMQRFEAAVADCRAALALDPGHAKTYSRMARAEQGVAELAASAAAKPGADSATAAAGGETIDDMGVRQLKAFISAAGLRFDDCTEIGDLRARARDAAEQH